MDNNTTKKLEPGDPGYYEWVIGKNKKQDTTVGDAKERLKMKAQQVKKKAAPTARKMSASERMLDNYEKTGTLDGKPKQTIAEKLKSAFTGG